jgi:hypothetical protein
MRIAPATGRNATPSPVTRPDAEPPASSAGKRAPPRRRSRRPPAQPDPEAARTHATPAATRECPPGASGRVGWETNPVPRSCRGLAVICTVIHDTQNPDPKQSKCTPAPAPAQATSLSQQVAPSRTGRRRSRRRLPDRTASSSTTANRVVPQEILTAVDRGRGPACPGEHKINPIYHIIQINKFIYRRLPPWRYPKVPLPIGPRIVLLKTIRLRSSRQTCCCMSTSSCTHLEEMPPHIVSSAFRDMVTLPRRTTPNATSHKLTAQENTVVSTAQAALVELRHARALSRA